MATACHDLLVGEHTLLIPLRSAGEGLPGLPAVWSRQAEAEFRRAAPKRHTAREPPALRSTRRTARIAVAIDEKSERVRGGGFKYWGGTMIFAECVIVGHEYDESVEAMGVERLHPVGEM